MDLIHFLIFIIYLRYQNSWAILSPPERDVTMELINELEIQHWILVGESNVTGDNLNNLKIFLKWQKPFTYFTVKELNSYFVKDFFVNANMLIVFKVSDIKIVVNFFNYIAMVNIMRLNFLFLNDKSKKK